MRRCKTLFFSPSGTTQKITCRIADGLYLVTEERDLLRSPMRKASSIGENEVLVVGLPVFSGRIPALCREMISRLTGAGGPAIAVVAYGNRDYDDALLELKDLLEERGFTVVAAGAFVAQHSVFPRVAAGRPDARDWETIDAFSCRCRTIIDNLNQTNARELHVKGEAPYKTPGAVPLKPTAGNGCTGCGLCARICPTGSISPENPKATIKESCISCGACVHFCPHQARGFRGPVYLVAEKAFYKKCAARREAEVFYREGGKDSCVF